VHYAIHGPTAFAPVSVPLTPLAGHQRIVAKVQQRMAQCDALKAAADVRERWANAAVRQLLDGVARTGRDMIMQSYG
jgi:hypothetical protein